MERVFNQLDILSDEMEDILNYYPDLSFKQKRGIRPIWTRNEDSDAEERNMVRNVNRYKGLIDEPMGLLVEATQYIERNGGRGI